MRRRLRSRRYPLARGLRRALCLVILTALLYGLTAGVRGLIFRRASAPEPGGTTETPAQTPAPDAQVSDTLSLPERAFYAIQLGAYSGLEAARAEARLYTGRGAAGYILEDEKFRVLAAVYTDPDDAETIRARLETQDIPAYVYTLHAQQVELRVTASPEQRAALFEAFAFVEEAMGEIDACSLALDRQEMTPQAVQDRMQSLYDHGETVRRTLREQVPQGADAVADALHALLEATQNAISAVKSQNSQDSIAMASQIKYNYLDVVCNYVRFNQTILAAMA